MLKEGSKLLAEIFRLMSIILAYYFWWSTDSICNPFTLVLNKQTAYECVKLSKNKYFIQNSQKLKQLPITDHLKESHPRVF